MIEEKEYIFIKKMLKAHFSIDVLFYQPPYESRDLGLLDHHLRQKIWSNADYYSIFRIPFDEPADKTLYCLTDIFNVQYALFPIRQTEGTKEGGTIILGPYLTNPIKEALITKIISNNNLSDSMIIPLKKYYYSLPVADGTTIISIINVMAEYLYGGSSEYIIEFINEAGNSIDVTLDFIPQPELSLSMKVLEDRYIWENTLLGAVAKGDRREAVTVLKKMPNMTEPRHHDSLRDGKNSCIILNTLLRKAAEHGVVHPVYLDEMSEKFAFRIEAAINEKQTKDLALEMVRKYSILVENQSLKDYSPQIRKAINYINLNLSQPLSLKCIAEELSVNPSYLSNLFKKEVHTTLTEYINKSRIETALKLLNSSDMQIQNIAWYVGINDVNYFTKLFKKVIGMTPSDYRTTIKG